MKKRVELKIIGRVQGVFFRSEVRRVAHNLGLTGRVNNENDGSVKIVAEGEEPALQKLIDWCKKGTKRSQVERVDAEWQEATGEFADFEIIS